MELHSNDQASRDLARIEREGFPPEIQGVLDTPYTIGRWEIEAARKRAREEAHWAAHARARGLQYCRECGEDYSGPYMEHARSHD
jgi:hypothetical protein